MPTLSQLTSWVLLLFIAHPCAAQMPNTQPSQQEKSNEEDASVDESENEESTEETPSEESNASELRDLGQTPDDIPALLQESKMDSIDSLFPKGLLEPLHRVWTTGTDRLYDEYQLDLGLNYTSLYQRASDGIRFPREGSGGDVDFFGSWLLLGSEEHWPGSLVFSTEARHRYSKIAPNQLGDNIGSVWGTTVDFNTQNFSLVQLYWERGSYEDGLIYRAGCMDPALIYDGGLCQ